MIRRRGHLIALGPDDQLPAEPSPQAEVIATVEQHIAAAEQALAEWRAWLSRQRTGT